MKHIISLVVFILGIVSSEAQISAASEQFALPSLLSESSGIIYFNDKIIAHNDSGNKNELYELDTNSGLVTRTVTISNAKNIDWEDITQDETSIYIGDIGNNISGNRTDLTIYKISKSDFLSLETLTAETIVFSYSDQTDFTATTANNTAWDAEALVSFDTSNLIVFTKNWINGITKGYLVSKTPGEYSLSPLPTTLNSNGLITGGTYNPLSGKLFLVGYTNDALPNVLQPFVWKCENFSTPDVFSGTNSQTSLFSSFSFEQTEAITYMDENNYFITSEAFTYSILSDYAKLISFSTNDKALSASLNLDQPSFELYPNPVEDFLQIKGLDIACVQVYDTKQVKLDEGYNFLIDMSQLGSGLYFINVRFNNHTSIVKKIIKK